MPLTSGLQRGKMFFSGTSLNYETDVMFDKLIGIEARYDEIERLLADPATLADYAKVAQLAQERSEITPIVEAFREYRQVERELDDTQTMVESEGDPELRAMALEESRNLTDQ